MKGSKTEWSQARLSGPSIISHFSKRIAKNKTNSKQQQRPGLTDNDVMEEVVGCPIYTVRAVHNIHTLYTSSSSMYTGIATSQVSGTQWRSEELLLEVEEDRPLRWLKPRWGLFWPGCPQNVGFAGFKRGRFFFCGFGGFKCGCAFLFFNVGFGGFKCTRAHFSLGGGGLGHYLCAKV